MRENEEILTSLSSGKLATIKKSEPFILPPLSNSANGPHLGSGR